MKKINNLWSRLCVLVPWPDCDTFDNDYDRIIWRDSRALPTAEELMAADITNGIPDPVPDSVERYQARVALHEAGHLTDVEAAMSRPETNFVAKEAWLGASVFRRDSETVKVMGAELGLTDDQIDDLFIKASKIKG